MKKIINLLLLTAFMAACACNPSSEQTPQDKSADPSQDVSPTDESLDPAPATTYKFVASALKEKWSAGDQIYVHGSLGSRAEVITLEDSQISEDGKTATVSLGAVTENLKDPDGLYAAFPDEAILHVKGVTGTKTTFTTSSRLLCVAYLKDDTFTFTDASSYISFSVQGDFDHFAFAAGNRDGMEATKYEIEYTSATSKFSVKSKDGDPYLTKSVVSGNKVRVWLPGGTTIKGGITIYFIKDEEKVMMYKTSDDVKIKMGEGLDLGDITSSIKPYDGSAPVMPVMGEMTKYSVKFDELSGLCLSKDGDFLWAVGDQGELAKISIDGKLENKVTIKTGTAAQSWSVDAEGVTVNPETGDLIISAEANSVVRIPAADLDGIFEDKTYYGVKEMFHISAASSYGNSGTEIPRHIRNSRPELRPRKGLALDSGFRDPYVLCPHRRCRSLPRRLFDAEHGQSRSHMLRPGTRLHMGGRRCRLDLIHLQVLLHGAVGYITTQKNGRLSTFRFFVYCSRIKGG